MMTGKNWATKCLRLPKYCDLCEKCRLPMSKNEETRPMESFYNIVQDAMVITGTAAYLERLLYFFFSLSKVLFLVCYVLCLIRFV